MKTVLKVIVGLVLILLVYNQFEIKANQEVIIANQETQLKNDSILITYNAEKDSTYWAHLHECSFISRKQFTLDKNGYAVVNRKYYWDVN